MTKAKKITPTAPLKKSAPPAKAKATPDVGSGLARSHSDPVMTAPLRPTEGTYGHPRKFLTPTPAFIVEQPVAPSTLNPRTPGAGKPPTAGNAKEKK